MSDGGDPRRAVHFLSSAPNAIEWTAEAIVSGKVVALPTDTVYGIAASLSHPEALQRIFRIKGREERNVLPVLASSVAALSHVVPELDPDVALLLGDYWPGALTVVIPALPGMPPQVCAADGTIGVRVPNHPLAIEVIERAGGTIACTSANLSGQPPARTGEQVDEALGDRLDVILDGGQTPGGLPSTVIRVRGGRLELLRNGAIPIEHIRRTWRSLLAARRAGSDDG
jgi:L-threonylcarbamoyladenylate synthase